MTKYYDVMARIDGEDEQLFGSYVREDCVSEIECERDSWKEQGYKAIRIVSRETTEQPDPEVYADDIESGLLVIEDEIPFGGEPTLQRVIEDTLDANDGLCLDNCEDCEQLSAALLRNISEFIK